MLQLNLVLWKKGKRKKQRTLDSELQNTSLKTSGQSAVILGLVSRRNFVQNKSTAQKNFKKDFL